MLKKVVNLFLLTLPFLLNTCSKEKGNEPSRYVVEGIRNVILDSSNSHVLTITIKQTSGERQPVDIQVFGLPNGIPVSIWPYSAIGLPDFSFDLNFSRGGPPGIYPVRLVTSSAFYNREDTVVVINPGNDFTINGTRDVSLDDTMYVTVVYVSGVREHVRLEVDSIPKGVVAYFQPYSLHGEGAAPDFTGKIIFHRYNTSVAPPGTYPIRIGGINSSFSKWYRVNLTVP